MRRKKAIIKIQVGGIKLKKGKYPEEDC